MKDTSNLGGQRVAIYARFSSERQRESSIEEQVARCRREIEARGGVVSDGVVFADFAISGASLQRPGFESLMGAIEADRVDAVFTEDVSRISRDIADSATFLRDLNYRGISLVGVGDGIDTSSKTAKMAFTLSSLVNEMYIDGLRDKTLRAMQERARGGFATGGLAYGYRAQERPDGKKDILIDGAQAQVVRRIFDWYAIGRSRPAIAQMLNREGVAPPRSSRRLGPPEWGASTVRVVLHNEKYVGVWTFGETRFVKLPGTNTRRPRRRDPSEVIRLERPDLRIVDQAIWERVHVLAHERGRVGRKASKAARTQQGSGRRRYLLSGLLRCGVCGAPMTVNGGGRNYGCSGAYKKGTCANRRNIKEATVRTRVFGLIRDRFLSPEAAVELMEIAQEERSRTGAGDDGERASLLARHHDTQLKVERLVGVIEEGDASSQVVGRLREREVEVRRLEAALEQLDRRPTPPDGLPTTEEIVERFQHLSAVLEHDVNAGREALGLLLDESGIRITPTGAGSYAGRFGVYPAMLFNAETPQEMRCFAPTSLVGIAGAGFEPTTFGL